MLDYIKNNPIAGTYQYINDNSGALYIGSADNIWRRHLAHLRPLDIDIAIANEGFENFTFKVLETFPIGTDRSILRQSERKWIDYFDVENNPLHYNKPRTGGTSKYNMWNPKKVYYSKRDMFSYSNDEGSKPRRCFYANSPVKKGGFTYRLPIGGFNEPISPTIIYDLSQKWS